MFFATTLVFGSIYATFYIHETKGLRIDQMDQVFGFDRPPMDEFSAKPYVQDHKSEMSHEEKQTGHSRVEVV